MPAYLQKVDPLQKAEERKVFGGRQKAGKELRHDHVRRAQRKSDILGVQTQSA